VESSPAVVGGLVYVGSWDHNVYCLNATSGSLVWSYTTGSGVESSPAVVGGFVYVGCGDGRVYCLDATSGSLVWSYTTGSWVDSPAVVGGYVYVGSGDGNVYCLDATSGSLVWSYTTGGSVYSSPAVVYGVVYVGSMDGKIYAFGPGVHDVAVTNVTSSKTVVGQGFSDSINVTAANQGDYTETFNITVYANTTAIQTKTVTLTSGNSTTITFTWNTTGFAKGNYTISAVAEPVPGETDMADNRKEDGWVLISIYCDVNGDGIVDISDILDTALAFGSTPRQPRWNPNCDIDDNGIIDISDILEVALHYGETDP
jgi:hypothetical protein